MATLNITEASETGNQRAAAPGDVIELGGVVMNSASFTGTAGISSAFAAATRMIRVMADANCAVKVGSSSVVAAATDTWLTANAPEYFTVNAGEFISAITR